MINGIRWWRSKATLGLLVVLGVQLAGCGSGAGGTDGVAAPDHVRAVVIPVLLMAPLYIAQDEGYFADQNLEVEFVRLTRAIEGIPALSQGQVDVTAGQVAISMLNAIAGGGRIRAVAGMGRLAADGCTFHGFVTQRGMWPQGELPAADQIRGRSAEIDFALPHAYWLDLALRPSGLGIDDLDIVNVPLAATVDAFRSGAFDLTGIDEPRLTQLLASGDADLWKGTQEIVPDYQMTVLYYGSSFLDQRPEVGERFMAAFLRGVQRYNDGKTERNLAILERGMGLRRDQLTAMCWPTMDADGSMYWEGIDGYQRWAQQRGLIDRVLDQEEMLDARFLEAASGR